MKIRLLLLCLLLLVTLSLQVKANEDYSTYSSNHPYEDMNHEGFNSEHPMPSEGWNSEDISYSEEDFSNFNDEDFDEEDFDTPESPNLERIMEIVNEINEVYLALAAELEEYHNRNLKKVVNKLEDCVDVFSEVTSESEEELPTNCEDAIRWGLKIFSRAISLLEQRKCNTVSITSHRCIPAEIVDKYVPKLRELHAELEKEVLADEDEDGTADICKYFEEWEDGDHSSISEEHDSTNLQ